MTSCTEIRVRYAETDQMGVVHHAHYPVWFELGRSDWMRQAGIPYTEFEARGLFSPVVELSVRYRSGARYDEVVVVETSLKACTAVRFSFAYRVRRGEALLAEGETVHCFVPAMGGRPVSLARRAPDLWARLQQTAAL